MSSVARITLVVLVLDASVLAALELLYLPLWVGSVPCPITVLLACGGLFPAAVVLSRAMFARSRRGRWPIPDRTEILCR